MSRKTVKLAAAVDLGGSKILAVVADARGEVAARDLRPTPADKSPDSVIEAVVASLKTVISHADDGVAGVGLAVAGFSNPETGVVFASPNLPGWIDIPLRDIVARETGLPVRLINDARAAALGELHFGAARGVRNFVYLTISTGIGGGIVTGGKLYYGASGMAGEVGHMVIVPDGPPCACGNRGCWEQLASGTALAREARKCLADGAASSILALAGGDIAQVTAETVSQAYDRGDVLARELVARTGYYLGLGLANLVNIFNPEMIVIGGGLSGMGDKLLAPAYEEAGRRAFRESFRAVRFVPAALGMDSGVLGAAALVLKD